MKLYKVLNKDLTSPFKGFQFELGKKSVCDDFDESDVECSRGFYATDFNGLVYSININGRKRSVFEVEVGGKSREFNQFKRRFKEITILRQLSEEEIKAGLLACEEQEGYKAMEACYPINPFNIEPISLEEALELLEQWKHVSGAVRISVENSIADSSSHYVLEVVKESVMYSLIDSLGDLVWCSVWAYISSLFPTIKKWKYVNNTEGFNPFKSGIDLWRGGYVPSFDGRTWRLHTKNGIAWEEK